VTVLAFDTSALVAALVEPHPSHRRMMPWVEAVIHGEMRGQISTHALAETWAVLTRLPIDPPISPPAATMAVARLIELFDIIELPGSLYRDALQRCSERNARSGAVFDALHLLCAESSGADAFVTFNPRDFDRLATSDSPEIVVPPDPPAFTFRG
jgi:predicted nucleic acid-binding protein